MYVQSNRAEGIEFGVVSNPCRVMKNITTKYMRNVKGGVLNLPMLLLLLLVSVEAYGQAGPTATTAEEFSIRNPLGQEIRLSIPGSGVTPYSLLFPDAGPGLGSLLFASDGAGQLSWLLPASDGSVLTLSGGLPAWQNPNGLFWGLTGNTGTTPASNFIGTIDAQDLVFRTENIERARFDNANGGHFVPGTDNTYNLGSASLRWRDLYLGPASLHFATTIAETGTARSFAFGVDTTSTGGDVVKRGNLQITTDGVEAINVTPTGNVGIGSTFGGVAAQPVDATLAVQGDARVSRRGVTGSAAYVHLVDQSYDNGGGSAPYFFRYFLVNEADFRIRHNNNHFVTFQTGRPDGGQPGRMNFDLIASGPTPLTMVNIDTTGVDILRALSLTGANTPFVMNNDSGTQGDVLVAGAFGTTPSWQDPDGLFWGLNGNTGTTPGTHYVGTTDNVALHLAVGQGLVNSLILNTNASIQHGSGGDARGNSVTDLQFARAVSSQVASGQSSVLVGGQSNTASASFAGVLAGNTNTASGVSSSVLGGQGNVASGSRSAVAGGQFDTAGGDFASVGGGYGNAVLGAYGAVPGGLGLRLTGDRSFGYHANDAGRTLGMEISAPGVAVFGNTDMWLANNDNTPSQLRFYEAQGTSGTFPTAGTNFTAFAQNDALANDITYDLPSTLNTSAVSDERFLRATTSTVNTDAQLDWIDATTLVGSVGWLLEGNAGTNPATNFVGTTDAVDLNISTNSTTAITVDGTTQEVTIAGDLTVSGKLTGSSDSTILGDNTASQQLIVDGVVDAVVGDSLSTDPLVWDAVIDGDMIATGIIKSGGSIWIDGVTSGNHRIAADDNLDLGTTTSDTLTFSVASNLAFTIEPTGSDPNIIGGPVTNVVGAGSFGAVIGGGGSNTIGVGVNRGVISGGVANDIQDSALAVTIGGGSNNDVSAFADYSTVSGGQLHRVDTGALYTVIGGGHSHIIGRDATRNTVAGGGGNIVGDSTIRSSIGGGFSNTIGVHVQNSTVAGGVANDIADSASAVTIGGGSNNDILYNNTFSTISGGQLNRIDSNSVYATISGGGGNFLNRATDRSTIGGGGGNIIGDSTIRSTIAGGFTNIIGVHSSQVTISGGVSNSIEDSTIAASVGGGSVNVLRFNTDYATISGGQGNLIDTNATHGFIGGGRSNLIAANGQFNVVAGGQINQIDTSVTHGFIGGGFNQRLAASHGFIGGGNNNSVRVDAGNAAIVAGINNVVDSSANNSIIGAGSGNNVGVDANSVGIFSGFSNTIDTGATSSFIGGGSTNVIDNNSTTSVIVGGSTNRIDSSTATAFIGGGSSHRVGVGASGAVIVGGTSNTVDSGSGNSVLVGGNFNTIDTAVIYGFVGSGLSNRLGYRANRSFIGSGNHNLIDSGSFNSSVLGGTFNIIDTLASHSVILGGDSNYVAVSSNRVFVGGGTQNRAAGVRTAIVGGYGNQIGDSIYHSAIVGGRSNQIDTNSNSAFIGAGSTNTIHINSNNTVIAGGLSNLIDSGSAVSSIGGGFDNSIGKGNNFSRINGGSSNIIGDTTFGGVIGGGNANMLGMRTDYAVIAGGQENEIGDDANRAVIGGGNINEIGAGSDRTVISGGLANVIGDGSDLTGIHGGSSNTVGDSVQGGVVGGGNANLMEMRSDFATIAGGRQNAVDSGAAYAAIGGGRENVIDTLAEYSAIPGGYGLTLSGSGSFGFLGANVGGNDMTVAAANVAVFGNTDMWLANNNNAASQLRFYEPQAAIGDFPAAATNYTAFVQNDALANDITYDLPSTLNTSAVSDVRFLRATTSAVNTAAQLDWIDAATLVGSAGWLLTGNAGTAPGTNFIGTTDAVDFVTRTNNTERMRVFADGDVSIGTTGSGARLHILNTNAADVHATGVFARTTQSVPTSANINTTGALFWADARTTGTITNAIGVSSLGLAASNTVLTSATGINAEAGIATGQSSASVTDAYAVRALVRGSGGTITNGYGVYIENADATNDWGLYQSHASDDNYMAGNLGLGIDAPTEQLQVQNGNILLSNTNNTAPQLRLSEPSTSGTNYTSFRAPVQAANIDYVLPAAAGAVGQQLTVSAVAGTQVTLGWAAPSDARLKTDFKRLSGEDVLSKFRGMELGTWRYKTSIDPKGMRHYGVMAQDFNRAFGRDDFGAIGTDTTVNNIDLHGVSYLAIQGLESRTTKLNAAVQQAEEASVEQSQRIERLEQENAALRQRLERMEKLLLEKQ